MMLFWKIRYLDRADKVFKDRYLYLHTRTLDPVTCAAVELVAENRSSRTQREILKYRHLFVEQELSAVHANQNDWDRLIGVGPSEYFEDETGKEFTHDDMARIITGSSTARAIPPGAKQHDIDFMLAEPKPIPLADVSLTSDELRLLGYFVRDLEEMQGSAFMKDGPGTLTASRRSPPPSPMMRSAPSSRFFVAST
jgi:hypothetical protein